MSYTTAGNILVGLSLLLFVVGLARGESRAADKYVIAMIVIGALGLALTGSAALDWDPR